MRVPLLLSAIFVLFLASGASAHHPFAAEFDESKPVTLTGTVTKFEWKNPHAMVHIDGRDSAGQRGQWTIELGGMDELMKQGWTRDSIKLNDSVTIEGWRAKDGSRLANAKSVKSSGGAMLMAASSFDASPAEGQRAALDTQDTVSSETGATGTSGELPATASPLALAGLLGLLSLAGGIALRARR